MTTAHHPEREFPVILVVDDQEGFRRNVRVTLEKHGCTVFEADNGFRALHILDHGHPPVDLMVSDVNMPGMDGLRLSHAARERIPDIPILLMSAAFDGFTERFVEQDPRMYRLDKPFPAPDLIRVVRDMILKNWTV